MLTGHKLITLPPEIRFIVVGVIVVVWLAVRVIPLLTARDRIHLAAGTPRDYGIGGGAICPRCLRPIVLGLFGIKLGLGSRLIRCPYCGKWSVVQRRKLDELRAAEAAELADAQPLSTGHEKSAEEQLRDQIDHSRFSGPSR